MTKARKYIIGIICALCVGLLVYFVFFFGDGKTHEDNVTTIAKKSYTISFDTDTIEYTSGDSFMQGTTAVDENGVDLTKYVTVSCKPTNNISVKELTYSINQPEYEIISFTRKLVVKGSYLGPSISISQGEIKVPIDQIASLSSVVSRSGLVQSDDGFGNECGITASINADEITIGDYVATITAENLLGDTATAKATVTITEAESSIIKLTASSVSLNIGEKFNPQDYIKSAINDDFGDVTPAVICSTEIDTTKAGTYIAEYKIQGIPELKDESATLTVVIN